MKIVCSFSLDDLQRAGAGRPNPYVVPVGERDGAGCGTAVRLEGSGGEPEPPDEPEPEECERCYGAGHTGQCGRCEYCVGTGRGPSCDTVCDCAAGVALGESLEDREEARIHDREDR